MLPPCTPYCVPPTTGPENLFLLVVQSSHPGGVNTNTPQLRETADKSTSCTTNWANQANQPMACAVGNNYFSNKFKYLPVRKDHKAQSPTTSVVSLCLLLATASFKVRKRFTIKTCVNCLSVLCCWRKCWIPSACGKCQTFNKKPVQKTHWLFQFHLQKQSTLLFMVNLILVSFVT